MSNIRQIRQSLNMSQTELAEKIGVCPQLISMIETGHRKLSVSVARKLAPILSVKWYELMDDTKSA